MKNGMKIEIKKCVGEIIDTLCDRGGFDEWWYNLDGEVEIEITDKLEEIVKRRFEKMNNQDKCPLHPNANTYTSVTGKLVCVLCFKVIK
jgi:hypothetical protein